mgnify:CR=1 FL=1
MAHFAKLDKNNIVIFVTVGRDEDNEDELTARTGDVYKQTSYNTAKGKHWSTVDGVVVESEDQSKAFRGNYAGKGMFYDEEHDLFYFPKSEVGMNGWVFNTNTASWVPPKDFPSTNHLPNGVVVVYNWDDATLGWVGETTEGAEVRWDSVTEAWISI